MAFTWFLMVSWLFLPGSVQAQKHRIKVVVANASIHIKPAADSEVISSPALGNVFEVEAKVGEWYEVRHRTEVGVLITGYIHEKFVGEIAETPPLPPASPGIQFTAKLGGLYSLMSGYDYGFSTSYYDEELTISDSVANGSAVGFHLELGVLVLNHIELTGGVDLFSKKMKGTYSLELPNRYIYHDIASAEATANPGRNMMVFHVGLNFHLLSSGWIRPYVGGGGSYVRVKMDLLEDLIYNETFYEDNTHTIEITNVQLVEKSVNKLGFHVRGGVHFKLTSNISFFIEGRYLIAKTDVPHPLSSTFIEGEKIDIDLGGISSRLGISLFF